mmetsp:Transcript_57603/g.160465  ORF Transcript_57603/g.160465 Transcript_57603/m.160465 type:complete len:116 (+) Transcript_57603:1191-1538(+)
MKRKVLNERHEYPVDAASAKARSTERIIASSSVWSRFIGMVSFGATVDIAAELRIKRNERSLTVWELALPHNEQLLLKNFLLTPRKGQSQTSARWLETWRRRNSSMSGETRCVKR